MANGRDPVEQLQAQGSTQGGPGLPVATPHGAQHVGAAGIASNRPALERVQLLRQHERLLAGPDDADQEQHEDQLADVGVIGGEDSADPALHPKGAQQHGARPVDQQEAKQQEEAVPAASVVASISVRAPAAPISNCEWSSQGVHARDLHEPRSASAWRLAHANIGSSSQSAVGPGPWNSSQGAEVRERRGGRFATSFAKPRSYVAQLPVMYHVSEGISTLER